MSKNFAVNHNSLEITIESGHLYQFKNFDKDDAHQLINMLAAVHGYPEENKPLSREEILVPEKLDFLEDSDGGLKGNK
jgi:hypothetical protein